MGILASDSGSIPKCSFQESIETLCTRQHICNCIPAVVIKGGCLERKWKDKQRTADSGKLHTHPPSLFIRSAKYIALAAISDGLTPTNWYSWSVDSAM